MKLLLPIFLFLVACFTRVEATKSTTLLPAKVGTEIEEFAKEKALIVKTIEDMVDESQMSLLAKDIKYLPGPQLPENIAKSFDNLHYTNRKLLSNEKFYKYHGIDNRTGKKYAWYTNRKYTTELELRQKLAIKEDWGVEIKLVTEFDVPSGTWVSEGKAASQGVGYPGLDYQAVILNTPNSWIIKTENAFK